MEVPAIDPELGIKIGEEMVDIDDRNVLRYVIPEQAVGLDAVQAVDWPRFDERGPGADHRDKSDFFATPHVQGVTRKQPARHHAGLIPIHEVVASQKDDDQVDLIVRKNIYPAHTRR